MVIGIAGDAAADARCRPTLPVSVAVTDRDGLLLRPFTTADGRWRLPVEPRQPSIRASSRC